MRVVSFFSGIGAFDKAAESVGMKVLSQIEIDSNCQKLLEKHFPFTDRSISDIRKANKSNIPTADVFCGGFPCQDLSVAGKRQGLDGEQSGLFYEFHRVIMECKPKWVVLENVPGLLHSNGGRDLAIVLGGLTGVIPSIPKGGWRNSGFATGPFYQVAYRILDAQYFGIPQRRRRIFLVASFGTGNAAQVLFEQSSLPGTLRTRPRTWQASPVAGTITSSASGTARTAGNANQIDLLVFQKQRSDTWQENASVASTLASRDKKDFGDLVASYDARNTQIGSISSTIQKQNSLNAQPLLLSFSPASYKRDVEQNYLSSAEVASTLRARNDRGQSDADEHIVLNGLIRRLTPLECERLMGLPDSYTEGFSDSVRYSMLGNSIAYPVAKWIFERIAGVENENI